MYPDFNIWKKVGNRCITVLLVLSYFFPAIEIRINKRKPVILDTFQITDIFGNGSFAR